MSISTYVKNLHTRLGQVKLPGPQSVLFVVGNESADIDSCADTVLTAYLYSKFSHLHKHSNVFPLLNIPREDLHLRRDIVSLFESIDIHEQELIFLDDLSDKYKAQANNVNSYLMLLDHNRVTSTLGQFGSRVAGIIDHHDDEGLYKDTITKFGGPRIIKKAGSCSSLIVGYFHKSLGDDFKAELEQNSGLTRLALAPLLMDTSNMKNKVEEPDNASYNLLKSILPQSFDIGKFFSELKKQKKNIEGFSISDIIRKDYKQWDALDGEPDLVLGACSILVSLSWLKSNFPTFEQDVFDWAKTHNLAALALLTHYTDSTGYHREIALFPTNKTAVNKLQKFSYDAEDLKLDAVGASVASDPEKSPIWYYEQKNVSASRKQIAPLLRKSLHGLQIASL